MLIKQLNCIQIPEKWLYLLIILSIISVSLSVGRFFSAPTTSADESNSNRKTHSSNDPEDNFWKKCLKIAGVICVVFGFYFLFDNIDFYRALIDGTLPQDKAALEKLLNKIINHSDFYENPKDSDIFVELQGNSKKLFMLKQDIEKKLNDFDD